MLGVNWIKWLTMIEWRLSLTRVRVRVGWESNLTAGLMWTGEGKEDESLEPFVQQLFWISADVATCYDALEDGHHLNVLEKPIGCR